MRRPGPEANSAESDKAPNFLRSLTIKPAQAVNHAHALLLLQLAKISNLLRNLNLLQFCMLGFLRMYALFLHHLQRLPNLIRSSQAHSSEAVWEPFTPHKTHFSGRKGRLDRAKEILKETTETLSRDVTATLKRDSLDEKIV